MLSFAFWGTSLCNDFAELLNHWLSVLEPVDGLKGAVLVLLVIQIHICIIDKSVAKCE